jgi:hypothetical protein
LCTPGMSKIPMPGGVNLWGERPLYVNPVNVLNILTKVLAEDKSKIPDSERGATPRGPVIRKPKCKAIRGRLASGLKDQGLLSVKELWVHPVE